MVIAAALVAASVFGFAPACAAAPSALRDGLADHGEDGRNGAAPPIARYHIDEGRSFVLDRSYPRPLLRFDDNPEIWVLTSSRGPRGDIWYKNDVNEPMLRATKLGGMIVYTTRSPGGSAAALAGASNSLRLQPLGPTVLYRVLFQASVRASRAAQHLVDFETVEAEPASDPLIADSAIVVDEAFTAINGLPNGKALLAHIRKISFVEGAAPAVTLAGGTMTIVVAPSLGVAGRPSSRKILRAAGFK